jgi:hypothetical protein
MNRDVNWTLDLARGLGGLVVNQLASSIITDEDHGECNDTKNTVSNSSEAASTAPMLLSLLASAMDCW